MRRGWTVGSLLLLALLACKPGRKPQTPAAERRINATVITVRQAVGEQVTNQEIVIVGSRVRNLGEHDVWRLYDAKARTVTFVDDIARTIRTEPLQSLLQKRRTVMTAALPGHYPKARLRRGGSKSMLGVNAQQHVIEAGAYRRELWVARHPAIPEDLFVLMLASDRPSSPAAPMMRTVDEELLRTKGFPLADRSEVPLSKAAHVVDRTVTRIASRPVPEAMLALPRGYRDLTPKPPPSKKAAPR